MTLKRVRTGIFILLTAVTLVGVRPAFSQGAGTGPAIYSATYIFGQSLQFGLEADFSGAKTATLVFKVPEFPNAYQAEIPVPSSQTRKLTHPVDLTQVRLAPFTTITYWWVLQAADGSSTRLPDQQLFYADDRFKWQSLSGQQAEIFWTGNLSGLGQLGQDIVAEAVPRLQSVIGGNTAPFSLYIYPSSADLRSALRLTGRDWVGAHADPALGVLMVTAVNPRTAATDLRQTIPHEMTHFFLFQQMTSGYENLPVWLNEGLATLMETNPNPGYDLALATAVDERTLIPLSDLCLTFPAVDQRAILAYAQSASFMHFIQNRHGNQAIARLIEMYADGGDCRSGVERAFGQTLSEMDAAWQQSLLPRNPVLDMIQDNGIWLILLLAGFGFSSLLLLNPRRG